MKVLGETFTKKDDFFELKGIVKELANAQIEMRKELKELAEAQKRTEMEVEKLTIAQERTQKGLETLQEEVKKLAISQESLQEEVKKLAIAQKRTENGLETLQEEVKKLAIAQKRTQEEVGRLSDSIGFGLEDIARVVVPGYLKRHFNIDVDNLERRFFFIDKKEIEINLYGEGKKDGKEIIILGESKSRIYGGEVKEFRDNVKLLEKTLSKPFIKLMFGFFIHPSAQDVALGEHITLIVSYQR